VGEQLALVVALTFSLVSVGVVTRSLTRYGILDVPNHRSSHAQPVPRGGGLVVLPSVALGVAAADSWSTAIVVTLVGAAALGIVGLGDDVRDIAAPVRLLAQLVLTAITAAALLTSVSALGGVALVAATGAATLGLTGFVNVYNFMDGANGVAALMAAVSGGWFAYVGNDHGVAALTFLGLGLCGAAVGFLPWNFPRAKVFLGDVGSYSIGMTIGCLVLVTLATTHSLIAAVAPACVFLTDTTLTLVRRAARRERVMSAHREHVYQRLTAVPGSPWPAVATTTATLSCLVAAAALPWALCLVAWAGILVAYASLPVWVGRVRAG
jgi:UDP-N-acetylmuramyl pentapeptide phosphotransferase/UDP-N-acetylglucosamine-1-phosphate transferase